MIFQDLNPHGGIGANCTYGKIGPFQFAIDSGLHPKHAGNESLPRHDRIPPGELDFYFTDPLSPRPSGQPPPSFPASSSGPLFLSYPSSILIRRMLSNSLAVMKRQRSELNLPELPSMAVRSRCPLRPDGNHFHRRSSGV